MTGPVEKSAFRPLGHASPDRYRPGSGPHALLQRMAYWLRRSRDGGRVLDLGCGEGALLQVVGLRGTGVDLNPERLSLAAGKDLRVIRAEGSHLPFAAASFDVVVCMEVLEHVPDMAAIMREVHRVLKPGGFWLVSVPGVTLRSWYEMKRDGRAYYCDADEHYREFSPVSIDWLEHRFMRTAEFEAMFAAKGFSLCHRDGVRYLFPQWFSRLPPLQRLLESPSADRLWSVVPFVKRFPFWMIRVFRKRSV